MSDSRPAASVLIVDDEPPVLAVLTDRFVSEGFECEVCLDAEAALRILDQRRFDVLVADLKLPGMSGLELLPLARQRYPWIAFLMATGVDDLKTAVSAMKDGADDYLLKPFELDLVVSGLRRALERRRLEAEIESYRHHLEEVVTERTEQYRLALRQIQSAYDQTLQALGMAMDLRAHDVAGHSFRVSRYSVEIAAAMGYARDRLVALARAAFLHDIGKLGIPDAILLKPGPLTPEEQAVMRSHVQIGYDLVGQIPLLKSTGDLILAHQERYDGTGYPRGLKGDQIPLDARIFSVADALDAMTSDRPYRRALSFEAAWDEILRQSGSQFDPAVVRSFSSIPLSHWIEIRHQFAAPDGAGAFALTTEDLISQVEALCADAALTTPPSSRAGKSGVSFPCDQSNAAASSSDG